MEQSTMNQAPALLNAEAEQLFQRHLDAIHRRTDRLFAWLLPAQWLAAVGAALWISPRAWAGLSSTTHMHVWVATVLGGLIVCFPVFLAVWRPGRVLTRQSIAAAQMLMGSLFIHLTGGRIETHFHVFGSLAFLAFYRDWRVLITGTVLVAVDHFVRGMYYPQSVFGVAIASNWRWLEHAAWVLFEDFFLIQSCRLGIQEMRAIADRQAELVDAHAAVERKVAARTAELQQTAESLARSNKELEQFAYIASHDLQEPLRKVQTFGDMLVTQAGAALDAEGRDYLQRMQNAASRMQALINDLLSYARVTSQAKPFVPVDLARVAQEVISDLEVRVKSTGGRVELGELPTIESDPLQMRQLLQNLIGNSLTFHQPNAPPVVSVQCRIVKSPDRIDSRDTPFTFLCEITVQDNGIGFEEKYLDRIFAPFQRLHGRSEYEGTGMGLTICRKIVERHGGTITARSAPGQGATFIVTLPLQQPKEPQHA